MLDEDQELTTLVEALCGAAGSWSTEEDEGCYVLHLTPARVRELAEVEAELARLRHRFAFELLSIEQMQLVVIAMQSTDPYVVAARMYDPSAVDAFLKEYPTAPGG